MHPTIASPFGQSLQRYLHAIDLDEALRNEQLCRTQRILEELQDGDWEYLEELTCNAAPEIRQAFWQRCLNLLFSTQEQGSAALATQLKKAVEQGVNVRVKREIERDLSKAAGWTRRRAL